MLLCTYLTVKVCVKHSSVLFLMHSVLFCLSTVFYLFCTHNYACLLPLLCVLLLFSYFNDYLFLLHSFLAQTPLLGSISISLFVCMCAYVIVLVCTMCFLFTLLLWVNTSIPLPVYHCLHSVRMRASSHKNKPYREQKRKRKYSLNCYNIKLQAVTIIKCCSISSGSKIELSAKKFNIIVCSTLLTVQ